MPQLSPGTTFGPYRIDALVGSGGMGQVYRATDPRLGRTVAIKILSPTVVRDEALVARFEREARLLASLNHPNIAAIHGVETAHDVQGLVLEFVDGQTLAERLAAGRIPLTETLTIARQVADALHAAHDKGIVHRDLKPGNIALTAAGQVKVLDFGIAKAVETLHDAATVGADATEAGMLLGTVAYMSPEQVQGKPIDKRTDIWAFGGMIYEMLAGRRLFSRGTPAETLAAILGEPPDWTALPAAVPSRVRWLVRRCLEKNPKRRLHDIADARIELDEALDEASHRGTPTTASAAEDAAVPGRPRGRETVAWIVAGVSVLTLAGMLWFGRDRLPSQPDAGSTYNVSINPIDGLRLSAGNPPGRFALSPDGRRLALVASDASGPSRLWIRPLDSLVASPLAGTEDASFPFWSPDSRFVAFLAQGKLKKIDASGGVPVTVCDAALGSTGSWSKDNVILFTPKGGSPLYRVSAAGGTPSAATTLDVAAGDVQHWYPTFLPDGRHFLFFVVGSKANGTTDPRAVYIGQLDSTAPPKLLLNSGTNAKYASGHLVYLRDLTLVAQAFDPERLELRGEPVPLVEQVQIAGAGTTGVAGAFTVSETGVLAYQTGNVVRSQLAWYDRTGTLVGKLGDLADYAEVSLSPDGARAAVSVTDLELGTRDVWIYDVARGTRERFTFDRGDDFAPIWSPAADRIAYSSRRVDGIHLYQKPTRGSGDETLLFKDELGKFASHWSWDGQRIVYIGGGGIISRSDLWILALGDPRKATPFLDTAFVESHAQFSPDGQWIAYMSRESGAFQVYARAIAGGVTTRISAAAGGGWPRWRRDGKEIYYVAPDDTLMAVVVGEQKARLTAGTARPLFKVRLRPIVRLDAYSYDVTADGQRFILNTFIEEPMSPAITLVVNWPGILSRK